MAALFQRLRRNPAALMDEDHLGFGQKGSPQEQSRRPGLFRRMIRGVGDSLTGRPDREPNVLDFILRGWQGVDAMRDNQMQRDMFGMRVRQSKMEEGQADEQRRNIESAIGSLDPEMQPWARLAPEQAAQAQFRAMSPAERFGDLERIDGRLGQRNQLTGQYECAPQVPYTQQQGIGTIPSGQRYNPQTGQLENIQGGPQQTERSMEQRQQARAFMDRIDDAEQLLPEIARARGMVNNWTAGAGSILANLPGTDARNLQAAIDTIKANLGFEALAEMRANSPTGGALGQVTERELQFLQSTVDSLDQAQSPQEVQRALTNIERAYQRSIQRIRAAYRDEYGEDLPAGAEWQSPPPQGVSPEEWRAMTPEERALFQ